MAPEFDFIIAGGGAAGCLLANRLSANPAHRVLLLEAGGEARSLWAKIPVGYRNTIGNPAYDWCLEGEPEPGLNQRRLKHPRGKALGGSTVINGMVAIRGQAADYDGWRSAGLSGWGWDDVLPHFKRHEDFFGGASHEHGQGGEWRVDAPRMWWPVLDAVQAAAVQAGIPATEDFNRGDNLGVGPVYVNQKGGWRQTAHQAFLQPVLHRPNLVVQTGALVDKVLIERGQATGLRWHQGVTPIEARALREVVLAAGALGTPQILMRSGIGDAGELAFHGINVIADRPGVGANLQDHLQIGLRYEVHGTRTLNPLMHSSAAQATMALRFALTRHGPLTMAPCQLGLFACSSSDVTRADLGYNVLAFSRGGTLGTAFDNFEGLTMIVYDLRPSSRGRVRLTGRDARLPPAILANYLGTERDCRVAANAIRRTRAVMRQSALQALRPQERWAGALVPDGDETGLVAAARAVGVSIFHPVGTAKMGTANDTMAVVDHELRAHGITRLRVADASIMPTLVSGNTATPTLMIAEKAASMILAQPDSP